MTPAPSQPAIRSMSLAYTADGTPIYRSITGSSAPYQPPSGGATDGSAGAAVLQQNLNVSVSGNGDTMKRKRGRPRKYGTDGSMRLAITTAPPPAVPVSQSAGTLNFSSPTQQTELASPTSSLKKARGRPPGSSKKQQMVSLGSAGFGFTPHIISVKAGEDVSSKIMSFSQHGPRAVCILSASGAISNVTLRQSATSGGTATYEGRFDILSLSGSFLLSEVGGQRSRTGGLSVSLAGPDGRVLGGCVAGLLTAASPVQVIVGSFIPEARKEPKPVNHVEPFYAPAKLTQASGVTGPSSPPSRGTLSESSGGPGSPLNQSTGACNNNNNPQSMSSMPWK